MIEIGRILCPVDFSEFSQRALHHAMAMAKWYEARLTVLHIFVNLPTLDLPPIELTDSDRQQLLTEMRQLAGQPPPSLSIDFFVREAPDIHREILDQAEALKADLLVIGSHGRTGFEKLLLGSVTETVIRKVTCPLMVVPRGAPDAVGAEPVHFSRILCPVDFSDASVRALEYAMDIAQEATAQLTVVHVIEVPPELRAHYPASGDFNVEDIRTDVLRGRNGRAGGSRVPPDPAGSCRAQERPDRDGRARARRHRSAGVRVEHGACDSRRDLPGLDRAAAVTK